MSEQWQPKAEKRPGLWRRLRELPTWVQVVAWIIVIAAIVSVVGSDDDSTDVASGPSTSTQEAQEPAGETVVTDAPSTTARATSTAAGPKTTFRDGTHRVGTDIAPGTYRNSGGTNCYWERLSGFGGSFGEIITNGSSSGGAPVVVTISASDAGFTSNRCGTWERV